MHLSNNNIDELFPVSITQAFEGQPTPLPPRNHESCQTSGAKVVEKYINNTTPDASHRYKRSRQSHHPHEKPCNSSSSLSYISIYILCYSQRIISKNYERGGRESQYETSICKRILELTPSYISQVSNISSEPHTITHSDMSREHQPNTPDAYIVAKATETCEIRIGEHTRPT